MKSKSRVIKLTPEATQVLKGQLQAFHEKFGRGPGPNDPVFFDPDYDTPTPWTEEKLTAEITEAARKAGVNPARLLELFRK